MNLVYKLLIIFLISTGATCFSFAFDINSSPKIPLDITLEVNKNIAPTIKKGYDDKSLQYEFIIKNTSSSALNTVLYFDHYLISHIQLFKYDSNGNINSQEVSGSNLTGHQKTQASVLHFFKIELKSKSESKFLLKIDSHHKFNTKIFLLDSEVFQTTVAEKTYFYIFFLTIMVVIAFFTFSIGIASKDLSFIYYSFFSISLFITACNFHGLSDYLFPIMGKNFSYFRAVFSIINMFFSVNFAIYYLNFNRNNFRLSQVFKSITIFMLISIPLVFALLLTDVRYSVGGFADFCILIGSVSSISIGILSLKYKKGLAIFYLSGWGTMALFAFFFYLGQQNIYVHNDYTRQLILIGSVFQILVFSAGLAYRFSLVETEKNNATVKALVNEKYKQLTKILIHDIANGLNVIKSSLFLMQNVQGKNFSPDLLRIQKASNHLIGLLDHVKESIKENHKLKLTNVNLTEAINESLFFFKDKMKEKNIIINTENLNFIIYANKTTLINDVLNNIISNAIKFSFLNSKIDIWAEEKNESLFLFIQDYGNGLSEENIRQFYLHHELPSTPGTNGEPGTGFGLNLAKSYMDLYGGYLEFVKNSQREKKIRKKVAMDGTIVVLRFKLIGIYALDESNTGNKKVS